MPPKRKTAAPTAIATAGTLSANNTPVRRRGRPPIKRINNEDANNDDDDNEPQAKRLRMEDAEASQDSDPQSLSEKAHDVDATSRVQDIPKDHSETAFLSDRGQKEEHPPSQLQQYPETDGEEDGEFSTGLRKETSENPLKKTRGVVSRRGKGVLPATRSSPRKQAQAQLQTRQPDEEQLHEEAIMESSLRSPSLSQAQQQQLSPQSPQTTSAQLQRVKRKRGRPPKVTTRVADSQSLPDQPAVTADKTEERSAIAFAIATAAGTDENTSPVDSGGGGGGGDLADDGQQLTAIIPSQAVSSQPTTTSPLGDVARQQQEIPRLTTSPEHHHQATASPSLDVSTHPHRHPESHPHPHVHPHPHPSSLYPPMQYAYAYPPHHSAPSHYSFAHPPPPAGTHAYPSSTSHTNMEYSPSFASTVPTTPGGSFTSAYPHHPDQTAPPTHPHPHPHPHPHHPHPHPHAILDHNAPHGNPFPPPGAMGVSNYEPSVYAVPPPIPSPSLTTDTDERERNEAQLGLSPIVAVNGGPKRKVIPVAPGSKAGGRAGRGDHVACHFCRGRKLKCDGRRPTCGHCSLRSLACAYDDFIRRRGPGKKEKNSKRNPKSPHSAGPEEEAHNQDRDQNVMLLGPDIAGVGTSQSDVLVTLPSQSHTNPMSVPSSSTIPSPTAPASSVQRRRRRNVTNNTGSSAQSGTSILRFDTAGSAEGNSASILSGLKPSAVAYAVETNERLPVNVNVSMPSVGMEYYTYHPHPQQPPLGANHDQHQHHQPHHEQHHHLAMSYAQEDQAVGYYTQPHPVADPGHGNPHNHYDEEQDEEDGEEDAEGDTEGPSIENQRPPQHGQFDPHPHHAYVHGHAPPPWPPEPPGAHAHVR